MNWIKCEDRLPKYHESVLIFTTFNNTVEFGCLASGKRRKHKIWMNPRTGFIYGGTITHWQPLPEAPKIKKEGTQNANT